MEDAGEDYYGWTGKRGGKGTERTRDREEHSSRLKRSREYRMKIESKKRKERKNCETSKCQNAQSLTSQRF